MHKYSKQLFSGGCWILCCHFRLCSVNISLVCIVMSVLLVRADFCYFPFSPSFLLSPFVFVISVSFSFLHSTLKSSYSVSFAYCMLDSWPECWFLVLCLWCICFPCHLCILHAISVLLLYCVCLIMLLSFVFIFVLSLGLSQCCCPPVITWHHQGGDLSLWLRLNMLSEMSWQFPWGFIWHAMDDYSDF